LGKKKENQSEGGAKRERGGNQLARGTLFKERCPELCRGEGRVEGTTRQETSGLTEGGKGRRQHRGGRENPRFLYPGPPSFLIVFGALLNLGKRTDL